MFFCHQDDIMWLSAMLSDSEENESKPVHYDFHYINADMPNLLNVSIPAKLLKALWSMYAILLIIKTSVQQLKCSQNTSSRCGRNYLQRSVHFPQTNPVPVDCPLWN